MISAVPPVWNSKNRGMRKRIIYLVGFMASGKTLVGKALAGKLKTNFADTDEIIENRFGLSPGEIITRRGPGSFRKIEKQVIKRLVNNFAGVVSLGGGVYPSPKWEKFLSGAGIVVYLHCSKALILKRLENSGARRPLVQAENLLLKKKKIETLLSRRLPFYKRADVIVNVSNRSVKETIKLILEKISKYDSVCN